MYRESEILSPTEKISLIKPEANDGFREDTNKKVENIIQKSSMVIIYGMSLGETDKKWWVYLGRWKNALSQYRITDVPYWFVAAYNDQICTSYISSYDV